MVFRILFANESGSGLSHVQTIHNLHQGISAQVEVDARFYFFNTDRASETGYFQNRIFRSPRELLGPATRKARQARTFGGMVSGWLFQSAERADHWISQWDRILREFDPHLVVLDYAPVAQMVAHGRWPVLVFGYGYTAPPSGMAQFPEFGTGKPANKKDEAEICANINRVLARVGGRQLAKLTDMCAADCQIHATVPPFDPYLPYRLKEIYAGVKIPGGDPWPLPKSAGGLAYFHSVSQEDDVLLEGLVRSGLDIDIYAGSPEPQFIERLKGSSVMVQAKPFVLRESLPGKSIAIHMGGQGVALAALFAGVPQLMLYTHEENAFNARMIASQNAGLAFPYRGVSEKKLVDLVRQVAGDPSLARGAFEMGRKLAPFRKADPIGKSVEAALHLLRA